jgi:amidohydrolase
MSAIDEDLDRLLSEPAPDGAPELTELRHDLHAHPQLGYEETHAGDLVQRELARLGIPFKAGVAETGVVSWITPTGDAAAEREAVALRADMDALPIEEQTGLPYASQHAGRMHACGHDGHTTILLGAARALVRMRDRLPRPVKLLFQPAEETGAGAARLADAGALDESVGGLAVGRVFGLHGWPELPLGTIATKPGAFFASNDLFRITVTGRGGHAAGPHLGADPIVAAAHLVTAVQSIVSRNVPPTAPAVLTVAKLQAGTAENIIPDRTHLAGTIRAMDEDTRDLLHRRLRESAERSAAGLGCEAAVEIETAYPVTRNAPRATEEALAAARGAAGEANVRVFEHPVMAAEDFAFYGRHVPACFLLLGLRPAEREDYPGLHTSRYDFNDEAIPLGIRLMCRLALGAGSAAG